MRNQNCCFVDLPAWPTVVTSKDLGMTSLLYLKMNSIKWFDWWRFWFLYCEFLSESGWTKLLVFQSSSVGIQLSSGILWTVNNYMIAIQQQYCGLANIDHLLILTKFEYHNSEQEQKEFFKLLTHQPYF